MIIEAICNVLILLLLGIVGLFPTLPAIKTDGLDGVFQALSLIDTFLSLKTVSACFVIIFVFANLQIIWSVIMWVVRKIPSIE